LAGQSSNIISREKFQFCFPVLLFFLAHKSDCQSFPFMMPRNLIETVAVLLSLKSLSSYYGKAILSLNNNVIPTTKFDSSAESTLTSDEESDLCLKNWMLHSRSWIGTRSLSRVIMPGTHDSVTARISYSAKISRDQNIPYPVNYLRYVGVGFMIGKFAANWTKTQGMDTAEQLRHGIRYFDLRIIARKDTYWTVHGQIGDRLSQVLSEVREFIREHVGEIVILDFNHLYCMTEERHEDLLKEIKEKLGEEKLIRQSHCPNGVFNSSYNELIEKGQVIVLYYNLSPNGVENQWHESEKYDYIHGFHSIASPWANQQTVGGLKQHLDRYIDDREANKAFVLQAVLTPSDKTIWNSATTISKSVPRSIKQFATMTQQAMENEWIKEWKVNGKIDRLNIVMMDYFESKPLLSQLIRLNREIQIEQRATHC
jgi:hypothetical protein